jgi:hypothetical protein
MKNFIKTYFNKFLLPLFLILIIVTFVSINKNNDGIDFKPSTVSASVTSSTSTLWSDVTENDFSLKGERRIVPNSYRTVKADINSLESVLRTAPFERTVQAQNSPLIIELPMPTGEMKRFSVTEYSMMEPGLAAQFPDVKTFNVKGIDDPYATGKLDITPQGFHGMVLTPFGDFYIDPYSTNEREIYISYFTKESRANGSFECGVTEHSTVTPDFSGIVNSGPELRTYRLANACTGEYAAFHGGTVALAQAAIVTAVNRVNGVYEIDFSVRMTLIANNTSIVYINAGTDPYTNNNGNTMLGQNQNTCDNVIGSANYDFGHVFSTGGGGVAGLRVICVSGQKARGVTGLGAPVGDPFYIDYVAHEMGHQFGGNHTFNSTQSSCNGNRNASTAWEPGSASTIMGYAGICGASNLQSNSDPYFHSGSFTEIAINTQYQTGSECPVVTNTGNTPPVITIPAGGWTIPISTPFQLTGSAIDAQTPNSLTYCWEEVDLGPAGTPNSPSGNAPIFRSFNPDTSKTRYFPKMSNIVNGTQTIGELLPTYSRTLTFRLTVRDNAVAGGGVDYSELAFNVSNTAGPFTIISPNTALLWNPITPFPVLWNVANTNIAPVNCQNVNIKLSTDGGFTYPTTLASNTPNDGNQIVNLPIINTTTARIKVEAADNIFFDISNVNFTLTNLVTVGNNGSEIPNQFSLMQNYPNPFNPTTSIKFGLPLTSPVSLKIYNSAGQVVKTLISSELTAGFYDVSFEASNLASGVYFYELRAGSFVETKKMLLIK